MWLMILSHLKTNGTAKDIHVSSKNIIKDLQPALKSQKVGESLGEGMNQSGGTGRDSVGWDN